MTRENLSNLFNYDKLEIETRNRVKEKAEIIRKLIRRTAQDIIEIGQELREIKQELGHGRFRCWLKAEFNWSISTANKIMQVSRQFEHINMSELNFSPSALYLLAAPSTPESIRHEALTLAKQGIYINYSQAKQLVSNHKNSLKTTIATDNHITELDIVQEENQSSRFCSRDFFQLTLEREWMRMAREKQDISFMLCIIDNFKKFKWNDLIKNVYFKKIIAALEISAKRPADLITSYEEGKFMILLPKTNEQGAMRVAETITEAVKNLNIPSYRQGKRFLTVTLIVTSVMPSEDISLESIIKSLNNTNLPSRKKQGSSIVVV